MFASEWRRVAAGARGAQRLDLIVFEFLREFNCVIANSQHAVEFGSGHGLLQQPCVLQFFDIGQITLTGQSEHFQKFLRGDTGLPPK